MKAVCVSLAAVLTGCVSAAAAGMQYQRIKLADGTLCISSRLSTKQMKMEGILGSDLGSSVRGVFVTYPLDGTAELTLFVRPASEDERPLPSALEGQLQPVEGMEGLFITPIDNRKSQRFVATEGVSPLIGRFEAVCRDLPIPRQCSRPFRFPGLAGTYSFKREQLPAWRDLERALSEALSSRAIANCKTLK